MVTFVSWRHIIKSQETFWIRLEVNKNPISLAVSLGNFCRTPFLCLCEKKTQYLFYGLFVSWVRLQARECENSPSLKFSRGEMLKQLCHVKKTELERLINDAKQRADLKR